MLRPIAVIVSAILLSRPDLPREEAERFAKVVQEEAKQRDFDPLTAVAIVHNESGWHPDVVSPNGEDYGLGQIRARFIGACRGDDDPVNNPSAECQAEKKSLLDAETNLRTMARIISDNRKLCFEKVKSAALPRWLAAYQGLNFPKQNRWCAPREKTWQVIRYREWLVREVVGPKSGRTHKPSAPAEKRSPSKPPASGRPPASKAPSAKPSSPAKPPAKAKPPARVKPPATKKRAQKG